MSIEEYKICPVCGHRNELEDFDYSCVDLECEKCDNYLNRPTNDYLDPECVNDLFSDVEVYENELL